LERLAVQAVQFVLGIILARILTPTEYGVLGILIVFISISNVFIDSGFTKALIQKKDRSDVDVSTVFLFNIAISVVCYLVLWIISPYIADFYEIPSLTLLLKVIAVSLMINALFTVPYTLFTINLDFKSITKINLIAVVISGGIAIGLAYAGYGVWALIWQTLLRSLMTALLMWIFLRWSPKLIFSIDSFRQMFSYGSKLLVSSLLGTFFSQLNALLIGKYLSAKDLGFYTRGIQFSDVVFGILNAALTNVLLPGLAPVQDQREVLIMQTKKIIKAATLVIVPIFMGLAVMAEPIIRLLLTEKWMMAVPIMQIFCVARLITIICGVNINLLYVIGRTDLVLKQQYWCIAIRVILLIGALQFGIVYIAFAELLATSIHFFINSYYPGKIMDFGASKQLKAIWLILLSGTIMILPLHLMNQVIENDVIKLVLAAIISLPIYFLCMRLFQIKEFFEIIEKTRKMIGK
jgi:O-antigen/teichoic acid export membrane protein